MPTSVTVLGVWGCLTTWMSAQGGQYLPRVYKTPGPRDQSCTLHAGIPTPPIACFDKHIPAHCMLVYTLIYEQNNRVTYTCKKITFPQLHFWALNMWWILNTWARLYAKVWVWSHRWHVNVLWSDRWAQSICMSGQVSLQKIAYMQIKYSWWEQICCALM